MKVIKGDLIKLALDGKFNVIIHGCNCFHTMNSGIARQMRETFPQALEIDKALTKYGDPNKLGTFTAFVETSSKNTNFTVVNAYTQFKYGYKGAQYCDYDAISNVFKKVRETFGNQELKFGYPRIGAGLGGGDWFTISRIIDEELEGEDHTLVEYSPDA